MNRKPADIKLSEVIRLLEGSVAPTDCVDNPDICERSDTCVTRDVWCEMKTAMDNILDKTTIQDMVERQNKKGLPEVDLDSILD